MNIRPYYYKSFQTHTILNSFHQNLSIMSSMEEPMSLRRLLDEPKGKTEYHAGEAFLLHVFWEAPNLAAAEKVLSALKRCGNATHRDTPCVPTYFFRLSTLDSDLVGSQPMTIGQHSQLRDAMKKLHVGVPRPAVSADLVRRGLDPNMLDNDPSTLLPQSMQEAPVMLECTELYLDERSFYEHVGSKDYLDAYGEIMTPGLQNKHFTVRLGRPTAGVVDKILSPVLKEKVEPLMEGCVLWRRPTLQQAGVLFSMDIRGAVENALELLPDDLRQMSSTLVAFSHPLREGVARVLSVFPILPKEKMLQDLASLPLEGLEVHCDMVDLEVVQDIVHAVSFRCRHVVKAVESGYLVHEKAREIVEKDIEHV